jgi:hypothetical protein
MTAPKDWFDAGESLNKVKVVYDAVVGSPLYATAYGCIVWENNTPSVYPNVDFYP